MTDLYIRRGKFNSSINKLEESSDSNLYINYKDSIKKHNKTYRITNDIIAKLHHEASWGDNNDRITSIVDSIDTTTDNFLKKIKTVSTNVYGADIILGPIKSKIVSSRESDNNWYYILKKLLKLSNRVNEYYIAKYEKDLLKIRELRDAEEKRKNDKILETQKLITEENKSDEIIPKSMNELLGNIPDNWDD